MQRAGQRLDRETDGRWLAEALSQRLASLPANEMVVVDSVRIGAQVAALRRSGWVVTHIHLEASEGTLKARYAKRGDKGGLQSYDKVSKNWTEKHVNDLKDLADSVIEPPRVLRRLQLLRE